MELIQLMLVMLLEPSKAMQLQYQLVRVKTQFRAALVEKLLMMTKRLGKIPLISFTILFAKLTKNFVSANALSVVMKNFLKILESAPTKL
jgi:hypothetical protein